MVTDSANLSDQAQEQSRAIAGRTQALGKALTATSESLAADLRNDLSDAVRGSVRQRWVSLIVFCLALGIAGVVVTITLRRSLVKPIGSVVGDLTASAGQVATAAAELASSSQSLSRGATEQAASLEQTSASMEEMASMTRQNASNSAEPRA